MVKDLDDNWKTDVDWKELRSTLRKIQERRHLRTSKFKKNYDTKKALALQRSTDVGIIYDGVERRDDSVVGAFNKEWKGNDIFTNNQNPFRPYVASQPTNNLCREYQKSGNCRFGDSCRFDHGVSKKKICFEFRDKGTCKHGNRCNFDHELSSVKAYEVRQKRGICYAFQKGECTYGDGCRFEHEKGSTTSEKTKSNLCFAFARGACRFGTECRFIHELPTSRNDHRPKNPMRDAVLRGMWNKDTPSKKTRGMSTVFTRTVRVRKCL